jgi:K+-sensing histidine kinase KdpD
VSGSTWRTVAGCAVALAAPPAITLVVLAQRPPPGSSAGYAYLYLGAVTLVALIWGLGPAIISAVLSAGLLDYYFVPPVGRLSIQSAQDIENLALFVLAAAVVGLLAAARRSQEERALRLAESLRSSNRELERRRVEAEEGRRTAVELAQVSARVDALADADRLKTELLANVSHELRTPLGAIVGMSSALTDPEVGEDAEQVRQYAATILDEGRHLARLVDDLLQMAGLEAGAAGVGLEPVASLETLRSAAERASHLDHQADVRVSGDHFLVLGDEAGMQGVLRNLIENAARYNSPIDLSCRAEGDVGHFEVADRGPGVPGADREAIFERFHRVRDGHQPRGRHAPGSGLGLAICKRLLEGMGGRIWYSDRLGGGAVFHFELPLFGDQAP